MFKQLVGATGDLRVVGSRLSTAFGSPVAVGTVVRLPISLTQEFMAIMLGASRPTVTVVAGTLQKAGLITYHRGHLKIVNCEKLESASCECYQTSTDLLRNVIRSRHPC